MENIEPILNNFTPLNSNENTILPATDPLMGALLNSYSASGGDVTNLDLEQLSMILAARNTPASGLDDPLDLDGDGIITVLDARAFIVESQKNQDTTPPDITAALSNDTGIDSTDNITFDPILGGAVTDNSPIVVFQAGFGNELVDISSTLQDDGSFFLDRDKLAEINGGELVDGEYTLMLVAQDQAGNSSSLFEVDFTFDSTAPILEINEPSDNTVVKPGDSLVGTINEEIASLAYRFNDLTEVPITVENGAFDIALELTNLETGSNTLTVIATDIAGNVTTTETTVIIGSNDITPPVIAASLVNDTGTSNSDSITSEPSIAGTVTDDSGTVVSLFAGFDNQLINFDVTEDLQADGSFSFNRERLEQIFGGKLPDGARILQLVAVDEAGNQSDIVAIAFTLDLTAPIAIIPSASVSTTFIDVAYDEAVIDTALLIENYAITIVGEGDSENIEIDSVQRLSPSQVRINLAKSLTVAEYALTIAAGIGDLAGNLSPEVQTLEFSIDAAPVEISPTNGEEMVTLTRETIVRFNTKVDPTTVNNDSFYLIANGERVEGRIVVSSTEKFATFFYDKPLPQSTEVRVVVDGDKIISRDGSKLDADGNGIAGGIETADFRTLPLTRIPGTDVFGYVYDSYNQNEDGSNIPLEGVVIRLDSLPEVFAVTDENGFFRLEDVPAPEFYVYIDGSNVTNAPNGTQYASLGKAFHSVPGQEVQLEMDGEPFDVYLPVMAASDIVELSDTEDTDVGFGEASLEFLQREFPDIDPEVWQQTQVTFVAGSATDDAGNTATQAIIVPVDPERLPAPLPPGTNPGLVISIQAGNENGFNREADGGATNFDVPAPVTFPNLEGLEPGEKSLIWTFNHDAGDWEIIGTGTVSEDGKSIVSDEGVGILAPGWHFVNPGSPTGGPDGPKQPEPPDDDCDPNVFTIENAIDLFEQVTKCAAGFTKVEGLFAKLFNIVTETKSLASSAQDLIKQINEGELDPEAIQAGLKTLNSSKKILKEAFSAIKDQNPVGKALAISKCLEGLIGYAVGVCDKVRKEDSDCDTITVRTVCNGLDLAKATLGKVNSLIEKAKDGVNEALFALICGTIDQIAAGLGFATQSQAAAPPNNRFTLSSNSFALSESSQSEDNSFSQARQQLQTLLTQLDEFLIPVDAGTEIVEILDETTTQIEDIQDDANKFYGELLGYPGNAYYLIEHDGFQLRGQTDNNGKFDVVLAPDTDFTLSMYDSASARIATYSGRSAASGSRTQIPALNYITTEGIAKVLEREGLELTNDISNELTDSDINGLPDIDKDGLVDLAEHIIGTDIDKIDTDNDGINDLAEIEQGLDPLGGQGFPTGIISSLPLQGEAKAITVEASTTDIQTQTAYIATGSQGLAIVDASQFNNPIILGQLDLLGDATDVSVDTNLQIAAVASNSGGLQLVDVSDPMLPTLSQTVNISANKVEVLDGIAYATFGSNLKAIDLLTGDELQELTLPGSGTVTDLAREGNNLYAYTSGSDTFSVVDITNPTAAIVQGQVNVSVASSVVGISVGNGFAYLGGSGLRTIDISDPSNPTLIGDAELFFTARDVTLNGSGLALVAAEGQGLGIYNISDPTDTDNFVTQIDTPGFTNDIAIVSGIAFVADGSSGLQVINYLGFDNQGQAPNVTISSPVTDFDLNQAGIQVLEGSSLPIQVNVEDDVQVRNVELLVNGEVVSNDVSFPFDLTATALNDDPEATTVDIQVRATDTGGNSTLSNTLTFNLVPDIFAPNVISTSPKADGRSKNISGISVRFDEPIDTELLDLSGITLTNLGADEAVSGGDDTTINLSEIKVSQSERSLFILPPAELVPAKYQLIIDPSIIADRAGNALTEAFTLDFTKRPLVTSLTLGETITASIVEPGEDEVYTFEGTAGQRLYFDGLRGDFRIDARLISPSGVTVFSFNNVTSDRVPLSLLETGEYQLIVDGSGTDITGDYSFRLLDLASATNLNFDTPINGTLEPGTETDLFQFEATAGQRLLFDDLGSEIGGFYTIYGPGNQFITSRTIGFDGEINIPSSGTYTLVLQGSSNNEVVNYSFQITELEFDDPENPPNF